MYCIDDGINGIVLNYSADWSDNVRVAWFLAKEFRVPGLGPLPPSLQECHCVGSDLISGRFTRVDGPEPPIDVITRAVALAVETYLRHKMEHGVAELFINRGKV